MYFLKNSRFLFWTFIYLIILLQLCTNSEIPLIISFLYSTIILITVIIHELIVRKILFGRYHQDGKTNRLIIYTLFLSISTALFLAVLGYYLFKLDPSINFKYDISGVITSLFFGLLLFTILLSGASYAFALFKQKIESEKRHQELKNNVLEMEMEHLRTQLSPHFTFNILNNLQFLILKDQQEALELLSRYSKILRYYIYESKNKYINLEDEFGFLTYFFLLEKDRAGENLQTVCNLNIPKNKLAIIPFLLSTFIENAFKHVSSDPKKNNFIHIHATLQDEYELNLTVENSYSEVETAEKKRGVGLEQAKKRLELSYPKNYVLNIKSENGIHKIDLKLKLIK